MKRTSTFLVTAIFLATFLPMQVLANRPSMVFIPSGEFLMGDHHDGCVACLPVHGVYLDPFYMSRYEITNQQYCDSLNAANSANEIKVVDGVVFGSSDSSNSKPYCNTYEYFNSWTRISFDGSTFTVLSGKTDHPVVEVSWYGAAAYCNWQSNQHGLQECYDANFTCDFFKNGYRLPTEAEWEYAARGGEHNPYYRYPWGDSIDGSKANYGNSGDPYESGSYPWTTPVGYYDGGQIPAGTDMANGYGLYDMVGNAREWCHDWYDSGYYNVSPYNNPTGPVGGTHRVLRGDYWNHDAIMSPCRLAFRGIGTPNYRGEHDGFGFRIIQRLPERPITLIAENLWDGKSIKLEWDEGVGGVRLVRTDANDLNEFVFATTDASSFTDATVEPGKTYKYVLKSTDLTQIRSNMVKVKAEVIVVLVRGYSPFGSGVNPDYWKPDPKIPGLDDVKDWFEQRGVTCWDPHQEQPPRLSGRKTISQNEAELHMFIGNQPDLPEYKENPPAKINLIGHSMGGLISRRHAGSPSYVEVDKIFSIQTPHTGSPLADIYGYWPMNPATWDLRPDSLESFNKEFTDLKGTKLYAFWSINYTDNANDGDLKLAHAIMSLDQRFRSGIIGAGNDGAVPKLSDVGQIRERPLLLPLPIWILKQKVQIDDSVDSSLDHYTCYRHPETLQQIMYWMGLSDSEPQSIQMAFEATVDSNQPEVTPQYFVAGFQGQFDSDTPVTQSAPLNNSTTAYFRAITSDANCSFTLQDPCGTIYDPCYAAGEPDVTCETEDEIFLYEVNSPIPGSWVMNLSTTITPPNSVDYGLTVFEDANIALYSYTNPDWANTDANVLILAMLTENNTPVIDANLTADITLPDTNTVSLILYDDGLHNDVNLGDGIYANTFTSTNLVGKYYGLIHATGTLAAYGFERSDTVEFSISAPDINFVGDINDVGIDLNGNGLYDILRFTVPVNVNEPNEFLLTATLFDSNDNIIKMLSTGDINLPVGPNTLILEVTAEDIVKHDVNGPYTLSDITLSDANTGLTIAATADYNTTSYAISDFEPLDTDGDGLADIFEISIGTDANLPDSDYDGLSDYVEIFYDGDANSYNPASDLNPLNTDTDSDCMSDGWEVYWNFDPLNDDGTKNNDDDSDGLTNLQEYQNNTEPNSFDTDADGMPDGWEVSFGFNPAYNDGDSSGDGDGDADGLTNLQEYQNNTLPNNPDTDDDTILDGPDNCKLIPNPDQSDMDADGTGDECDLLPDLSNNGIVDFRDFALFALHWYETGCIAPDFCNATDFDKSGTVGFMDLSEFAQQWLESVE